jgi:GxxExxY protein
VFETGSGLNSEGNTQGSLPAIQLIRVYSRNSRALRTETEAATMGDILYPEESYRIIGACFEVYNEKGCGLTEPIYQECLEIELDHRQIPFLAQPELLLEYRGRTLKHKFRPDFLCFGKIVLELKAVSELVDEHRSQVINYLHASKLRLGILVNFGGHPKLEYERFALTDGSRPFNAIPDNLTF